MQFHSYDPAEGHGLPHDPFKAIVAPRPIGWISSTDSEGVANLAPYSFFNAFVSSPPIIGFSSEGRKHSLANIEATGVFCFNLATRAMAEAVNQTSGAYPAEVDEFEAAGLEKTPCSAIPAPRVANALAALECKVTAIHRLSDLDGNGLEAHLVLGQVVYVHIAETALIDGRFDIAKAGTIARCGYRGDYAEVTETFEMLRPSIG
ncbi:Asp/Glu/hydantoin racemase [Devosia pacifica]|uniref:Asp/Glu/hydantoin racemase n=2 Tax=Devosia pacifica TaxID=1335967 RepID=A0A918VVY1_9HYPH|nr:flavin reductase family protein [Devosia pacifica]GHA27984.1 Asp/Glu/hydantoin racemase [Devosia pacifica]